MSIIAEQLELGAALGLEGMRRVTDNSDPQDVAVVDQAILTYADQGAPFSANDFRDLLPHIRNRKLIGARINALRMRRQLVKIGEVVSTDPGTHGKRIGVYVRAERA